MSPEQREDVKDLIAFYDEHGWNWSSAAEFLILRYNLQLERGVIRTRIGVGYERPKKEKYETGKSTSD